LSVQDPSELNATFSALFNSGDVDALADLYEKDAVSHSPEGLVTGRDAIRAQYADKVAESVRIEAPARQIITSGDIALIVTDWRFTEADGDSTGVSVEVARRQPDGTWQYIIDQPSLL